MAVLVGHTRGKNFLLCTIKPMQNCRIYAYTHMYQYVDKANVSLPCPCVGWSSILQWVEILWVTELPHLIAPVSSECGWAHHQWGRCCGTTTPLQLPHSVVVVPGHDTQALQCLTQPHVCDQSQGRLGVNCSRRWQLVFSLLRFSLAPQRVNWGLTSC